jgi:ribose transport system substrate-binding protein
MTKRRWRRPAPMVSLVAIAALVLAGCSQASPSIGPGQSNANSAGIPAGIPTMEDLYNGTGQVPPTSSPAPAEGKSIWWISCSEASSGCSYPTAAAKEGAKALGWDDFHVVDGKFNEGGAYSTAIRTAAAAGADAIAMFGIPCVDAQQAAQEARDAGIIIMSSEGLDCTDSQGKPFPWVMKYSEDAQNTVDFWKSYGRTSADYIINKTQGKTKLLVNAGGESTIKLVNDGFMEELKKCGGCEVVDSVEYLYADLTPTGPWQSALRTSLARHPDVEHVYFPFDLLAGSLGGLQAVQESGVKAASFGGQGLPESLALVRQGRYEATSSARSPGWAGYALLDNINRALQGKETVPQGLTFTAIDNDHGMPPEGQPYAGPRDWKTAYEQAWAKAAG